MLRPQAQMLRMVPLVSRGMAQFLEILRDSDAKQQVPEAFPHHLDALASTACFKRGICSIYLLPPRGVDKNWSLLIVRHFSVPTHTYW